VLCRKTQILEAKFCDLCVAKNTNVPFGKTLHACGEHVQVCFRIFWKKYIFKKYGVNLTSGSTNIKRCSVVGWSYVTLVRGRYWPSPCAIPMLRLLLSSTLGGADETPHTLNGPAQDSLHRLPLLSRATDAAIDLPPLAASNSGARELPPPLTLRPHPQP
jgi:hypothetical protein